MGKRICFRDRMTTVYDELDMRGKVRIVVCRPHFENLQGKDRQREREGDRE